MPTLAELYPMAQERLRSLIETYESLRADPGVNVAFALVALRDVQRRADEAAAHCDPVAMLRMLGEMNDCE